MLQQLPNNQLYSVPALRVVRISEYAKKLIFFCAVLAAIGTQMSVARPQNGCVLPDGLSRAIAVKHLNAHVVTLDDLNQDDQTLFQKEHGSSCPGLTRVDFYGDGKPTFALVLLRADARRAELVIAHQLQGQWQTTSLDTADSSVPVVWTEKPGKYDDLYGEKTLRATRPVVVLCGYNSWAIVYAWTGNQVEKIWVRD